VNRGPCPTAVTFRENPRKLLDPAGYGGDIFSLEQHLEVLEVYGVEQAVLIDFSEKFSKLKGQEFIVLLEDRMHVVFLVIGANFRCGYSQDTGVSFIKTMNEKRGIATDVVPPVVEGSLPVSSSRIRASIAAGDLEAAAAMLGRNPELDLRGSIPRSGGGEGGRYFPAPRGRILPSSGRYEALVRGSGCFRTVITARDGGVFIPFLTEAFTVAGVEFLTRALGP
jgi:riboflavin kinase/FMN adenylyltransferase